MNDLISVILPIYNVEKYLEKCLDSILKQTYSNLEIILVDDGSKDRSPDICDEYKLIDQRIVVIHKQNGGLSDARNAGIQVANGKYLVFVDSDDYVKNNMIERLYHKLIEDNSDMVICNYVEVDENGSDTQSTKYYDGVETVLNEEKFWEQYYSYQIGYYIVAWNKMYKRELFLNERYDIGKIHEDEYICHRIVSKCKKISCINDKLYFYVQRKGSIMQQTYSNKKFDIVEAVIKRSIYFKQNNMQMLAEIALSYSISRMLDISGKLNMGEEDRRRYKKEKKAYNNAYFYVIKGKPSFKFLVNGFSFVLGAGAYKFAHCYQKIFK